MLQPATQLREAGAVICRKTTMPNYGILSSGLSTFHALPHNPWDTALMPKGSSAGSGAAAPTGYGPLHLGTDIGGFIHLPTAYMGRVPIDPPYIKRVAGPLTRTVDAAALLIQILSQPDSRDCMCLPLQAIDWLQVWCQSISMKELRIDLLTDAGCGLPLHPIIRAAVEHTTQLLADQGAQIIKVTALHDI